MKKMLISFAVLACMAGVTPIYAQENTPVLSDSNRNDKAEFIADGWLEGDSFHCLAVDMEGNPLENVSFDIYENEEKVSTYVTGVDGQTPIHTPSISNLRFVKAETEKHFKDLNVQKVILTDSNEMLGIVNYTHEITFYYGKDTITNLDETDISDKEHPSSEYLSEDEKSDIPEENEIDLPESEQPIDEIEEETDFEEEPVYEEELPSEEKEDEIIEDINTEEKEVAMEDSKVNSPVDTALDTGTLSSVFGLMIGFMGIVLSLWKKKK